MADPVSVAAGLLGVTTAAIQSAKSLSETVQLHKGRDKTLRRLQDALVGLTSILESLAKAPPTEDSILGLLRLPVRQCSQVCHEVELSMKAVVEKSNGGFVDWTNLESTRGNINELIEVITGYKSTISVGLGSITMITAKVTQHVLKEYQEMLLDTTYNLQVQRQRIDEKMVQLAADHSKGSYTDVDLNDERDVTQQCHRVLEEATSYIEDLSDRASSLLHNTPYAASQAGSYEAQTQVRQALKETRDSLTKTSIRLARRLESLVHQEVSVTDHERTNLRSDIEVSKQCLDVCHLADEISRQKIYGAGKDIPDTDSSETLVTTLEDLWNTGITVKNGRLGERAGVHYGYMSDLTIQAIVDRVAASHGNISHGSEERVNARLVASGSVANNTSPDIISDKVPQSPNAYKEHDTEHIPETGDFGSDDDSASAVKDDQPLPLSPDPRPGFETEFVDSILNDLDLDQYGDEILDEKQRFLLMLLKQYCMLLSQDARDAVEDNAATLLRHSCPAILKQFQQRIQSRTDRESRNVGAMSFAERFDNWGFDSERAEEPNPSPDPGRSTPEHVEKLPPPSLVEFTKSRDFLFQSLDYGWLVSQMQRALTLSTGSSTLTSMRDLVVSALAKQFRREDELRMTLPWDPARHVFEQFPDMENGASVSALIAICGVSSDVQATTCSEYIKQVWPTYGPSILRDLDHTILASPKNNTRVPSTSEPYQNLRILLEGNSTVIQAFGSPTYKLEVAEVMIWLGTTCRTSGIPNTITGCKPRLTVQHGRFVVEWEPANATRDESSCWHLMFRDPVIAYGYPIPERRNTEKGLELSIELMTTLAQTPRAVQFCDRLFLKGFNSLLTPIKRLGSSVLWHLMVNVDGSHMPLAFGKNSSKLRAYGDGLFEGSRHFVGWTEHVDILVGSRLATYREIALSTGDNPGACLRVEGAINVSGGRYVTIGCKLLRSLKVKPIHFSTEDYLQQVQAAAGWIVILSDTFDRRHWMCDGASALLHLCRAWLSSDARRPPVAGVSHQLWCPQPHVTGRDAACEILTHSGNRQLPIHESDFKPETRNARELDGSLRTWTETTTTWFSFGDLVRQQWATLELIRGHALESKRSMDYTLSLQELTGRPLIGFEFRDIIENRWPLEPRLIRLPPDARCWWELVQALDAIHLFGSHFGELIRQGNNAQVCQNRCSMPAGEDHLAIPMVVVRTLLERRQQTANCLQLTDNLYWQKPFASFQPCSRRPCAPGSKCILFTQLHKSPGTKLGSRSAGPYIDPRELPASGGIIMGGTSGKLEKWLFKFRPHTRRTLLGLLPRSDPTTTSDSGYETGGPQDLQFNSSVVLGAETTDQDT